MRSVDVQLYAVCDTLSEFIIYFMVSFSPWAFGTTQPWSIWTMNVGGYVLGLLLVLKLILRWGRRYYPSRWDGAASERGHSCPQQSGITKSAQAALSARRSGELGADKNVRAPESVPRAYGRIRLLLAILTLLLLVYCLVGALNARATYHEDTLAFDYRDCIAWLPHSFDAAATWSAFWRYLGLACAFWAIIDWLYGKTSAEQRPKPAIGKAPPFSARLRRLLWALAISGALLGVEAIFQRLIDSPRLLFLVKPRIHQTAATQFGPYAYRSNAAQYFNLLWPVCLGFWWTLNLRDGRRGKGHHWLLACAALIAACPFISTSRAGALVTAGIAVCAFVILLAAHFPMPAQRNPHTRRVALSIVVLFFCVSLGFGLTVGWKALGPRLEQLREGFEGRRLMYQAARPMAEDFPLYGTGPGTFETVSYLYPRPDIFWPPQLHNDWLETRITFGWVGSTLLVLALGTVALRWFIPGATAGRRHFVMLAWLSLAGCLAHARFDFPFQVHSILLLFLVLCAILFSFPAEQYQECNSAGALFSSDAETHSTRARV